MRSCEWKVSKMRIWIGCSRVNSSIPTCDLSVKQPAQSNEDFKTNLCADEFGLGRLSRLAKICAIN